MHGSSVSIPLQGLIRKFASYFLVSLVLFLIYILIVWFFTEFLGFHYISSVIIGFVSTGFIGFFAQKRLTFGKMDTNHGRQSWMYLAIMLSSLLLDIGIVRIGVEYLHLYYLLVVVLSKGVTLVWNFAMNHKYTFKS